MLHIPHDTTQKIFISEHKCEYKRKVRLDYAIVFRILVSHSSSQDLPATWELSALRHQLSVFTLCHCDDCQC